MENRPGKWYVGAALLTSLSMLIGGCVNPKKDAVNPSLLPNPQVEPSSTPDYCGEEHVKTTIVESGMTFGDIINPEGKSDMSVYDGRAVIHIGQNNNATIASGVNGLPFAVASGYFDNIYAGDTVIYGYNLEVLNCLETLKSELSFEDSILISGSETGVTVIDHEIRERYTLIDTSNPSYIFDPQKWVLENTP